MRSKAPLALMEQLVMILVFALAAALCVQVFVLADQTSRRHEEQDLALIAAQNAAEILKSTRGDLDAAVQLGGGQADTGRENWVILFDSDWNTTYDTGAYRLAAAVTDSGVDGLGTAEITVYTAEGESLAVLSVAWQETSDSGEGADADA